MSGRHSGHGGGLDGEGDEVLAFEVVDVGLPARSRQRGEFHVDSTQVVLQTLRSPFRNQSLFQFRQLRRNTHRALARLTVVTRSGLRTQGPVLLCYVHLFLPVVVTPTVAPQRHQHRLPDRDRVRAQGEGLGRVRA